MAPRRRDWRPRLAARKRACGERVLACERNSSHLQERGAAIGQERRLTMVCRGIIQLASPFSSTDRLPEPAKDRKYALNPEPQSCAALEILSTSLPARPTTMMPAPASTRYDWLQKLAHRRAATARGQGCAGPKSAQPSRAEPGSGAARVAFGAGCCTHGEAMGWNATGPGRMPSARFSLGHNTGSATQLLTQRPKQSPDAETSASIGVQRAQAGLRPCAARGPGRTPAVA